MMIMRVRVVRVTNRISSETAGISLEMTIPTPIPISASDHFL